MKSEWNIQNLIQLKNVAKIISSLLKKNSILLYSGKLGAGKTTLTQLIGKYLGIKDRINSPTFQILKQYKCSDNTLFNHYDFFRYKNKKKQNILSSPINEEMLINNITIIEWPEYIEKKLWENNNLFKVIIVKIEKEQISDKRIIKIKTKQ